MNTSHRSPNSDKRDGTPITMIVIHATVGSARSALAWLTNPAARVSCHYLIDKRGEVYQLVGDARVAWHAGRALWRGVTAVNEHSLGIELENANDGRDSYPQPQLDALVALTREKVAQYQIAPEMLVRHLDVAMPRGRKRDPAGFPWAEFRAQVFPGDTTPPERPDRPEPAADGAALSKLLLAEAYRQTGAVGWPDWSMPQLARSDNLGLPLGPSFSLAVAGRNYVGQSFGRDVLTSPVGMWRSIQRLSQLVRPEDQPLRDALLPAIYGQVHETYNPGWAFHQLAQREPLGPPLGPSVRMQIAGRPYSVACYALDVLASPVNEWQTIERLTRLRDGDGVPNRALEQALEQAWYQRAGSSFRPDWQLGAAAREAAIGAPLGPSYRVSSGGSDYVAEAYALDIVFCPIGDWGAIQRLSELDTPAAPAAKTRAGRR